MTYDGAHNLIVVTYFVPLVLNFLFFASFNPNRRIKKNQCITEIVARHRTARHGTTIEFSQSLSYQSNYTCTDTCPAISLLVYLIVQ